MYKRIIVCSLIVLVGAACNGLDSHTSNKNTPSTLPSFEDDASTSTSTSNDADSGVTSNDASSEPDTSAPPVPHCGDSSQPQCLLGEGCRRNDDCASGACDYHSKCINEKSCTVHFGGDTCGQGEVGDPTAVHESCCKSNLVNGYSDQTHPGKDVYLDKYEITAGRIRAFVQAINSIPGGIRASLTTNPPTIWDSSWNKFLPARENDQIVIARLLLGDPRHDGQTQAQAGPGVVLPPTTDQAVSLGITHQFGGQVFADVHGNNCGTYAGAYGFPTYYYPADVMVTNGEVPRSLSQDVLDTKSMNCITNAMLQAFCTWDGGQLATSEVMDYVTDSSSGSNDVSGCGTQHDSHGELLGNIFTNTVQSGGTCPPVSVVNATFDAGDALPVPGSFLNTHNYSFPDVGPTTSDKVWEIAAPGRIAADNIKGWMDLAGNLSESVLVTNNGSFTGRFGLKYRGIGYGSSRSDLNVTYMPGESILRVERPEVKTALAGGRCMRFK